METEHILLNLVLQSTSFGTLLCGWLLFMRRRDSDRSRTMLAWCFTACGAVVFIRVLMAYAGNPVSDEVLLPSDLNSGLLTLLLFFLYPIEVIRPGWLTPGRIGLLSLPWVVFSLIQWFTPEMHRLTSFDRILADAGEFDVWLRLVFLALFVPLCTVLLYIPRNWQKSSADNRWIRLYTVGTQGIAVLYLLSMLTGDTLVNALHIAYCMGFCLAVTYQELYLRIRVPVERPGPEPNPEPGLRLSARPVPTHDADSAPLWTALNRAMEQEELWRNPDLTLEEVARRVGSNRTTLSQLIRQRGYAGYKEYVNSRRIDEFLRIADSEGRINVLDTFFRVGFRSKTTALRCFRRRTGTIPSDYLQNPPPTPTRVDRPDLSF